jgi:hypothetical protein
VFSTQIKQLMKIQAYKLKAITMRAVFHKTKALHRNLTIRQHFTTKILHRFPAKRSTAIL